MKKKTPTKKRMADGLMQGLKEAVNIHQGKLQGRVTVRTLAKPAPKWTRIAIKKLRAQYDMNQPEFAALLWPPSDHGNKAIALQMEPRQDCFSFVPMTSKESN